MRHFLVRQAIMQTRERYLLWLPAAVLVLYCVAGCGAHYAAAPFGIAPTAVHIQRTILYWDTNDGEFPAPPAINVTSTNGARVAEFFDQVRSLPAYPPGTPLICTGGGHGQMMTLISFLDGSTVLLQVKMVGADCMFTSIVGEPNTFLQTDDRFFTDLYFLIAYPT
jgi:hypothetical protein